MAVSLKGPSEGPFPSRPERILHTACLADSAPTGHELERLNRARTAGIALLASGTAFSAKCRASHTTSDDLCMKNLPVLELRAVFAASKLAPQHAGRSFQGQFR